MLKCGQQGTKCRHPLTSPKTLPLKTRILQGAHTGFSRAQGNKESAMRTSPMTRNQREELWHELIAINFWDESYAHNPSPTLIEATAWEARRRRVHVIVEQLNHDEWTSTTSNEF
jgi:hypothetical protein